MCLLRRLHLFNVVNVSIPDYGLNGTGTGEIKWHHENGIQFHIEDISGSTIGFRKPADTTNKVGSVQDTSSEPALEAHIEDTEDIIRVYGLISIEPKPESIWESETPDSSPKMIFEGSALLAKVNIKQNSEISFTHETKGETRLLISDFSLHLWPDSEEIKWHLGTNLNETMRRFCPLSIDPFLTLYSTNNNIHKIDREASWLVFDSTMMPKIINIWYTPDECMDVLSLLSFLIGKRLKFLWMDQSLDDSQIIRTYYGAQNIDDNQKGYLGYQPIPFKTLEYRQQVTGSLPALYKKYRSLRKFIFLDWIVGPLWYARKAYLNDNLSFACLSLERFAAAHKNFIKNNPGQQTPKKKFLTRQQLENLKQVFQSAIETKKLILDENKIKIIEDKIGSFNQKTNPDMLIAALEFDGLTVSDQELEVIKKRNDCLHGRQTLQGSDYQDEINRFDTLRTLIHKAVLARLEYRGPYIDYAARPSSGEFPINNLGDELNNDI